MHQSRASHDWGRASSERRILKTLQVPSEDKSGNQVDPQQYWYEDSDELEQVPEMKQLFIVVSVKFRF